jgi:hypothetical protein
MKDEINTIVRMMTEIIEKCKLHPEKYKNSAWTVINVPGVENCQVYFNENWKAASFMCEHLEYAHYSGKISFYQPMMNNPLGFQIIIESLTKAHSLVFKGPTKRKLNFN